MVSDSKMSDTHQAARSKGLTDHSPMEDSTVVPSPSGDVEGLSKVTIQNVRPDTEPTGQEFIMNKVLALVAWPICFLAELYEKGYQYSSLNS